MYKKHIITNGAKIAFFALFCLILSGIISSCGSRIAPVKLYVTRTSPFRPLPPLNTTITDTQAVQQLYQAAYNLPDVGSGTSGCLNNTGIVYHLTFYQDANNTDEMDVAPSGCLILTTSQGPLQENDAFLNLVAKTIHVNPLIPLLHIT